MKEKNGQKDKTKANVKRKTEKKCIQDEDYVQFEEFIDNNEVLEEKSSSRKVTFSSELCETYSYKQQQQSSLCVIL